MQSMEQVYKEHAQTVFKYIFCLTNNENLAEEITQETFYRAVKQINKFNGTCKVSVWLCQIAKNVWYDELRKKKKKNIVPLDDNISTLQDNTDIENDVIEKEDKINIFKQIQKLDNITKEVIYLRLNGDLSFKEIGEILQKSETWARVTFYRGKVKLKECDLYEKSK